MSAAERTGTTLYVTGTYAYDYVDIAPGDFGEGEVCDESRTSSWDDLRTRVVISCVEYVGHKRCSVVINGFEPYMYVVSREEASPSQRAAVDAAVHYALEKMTRGGSAPDVRVVPMPDKEGMWYYTPSRADATGATPARFSVVRMSFRSTRMRAWAASLIRKMSRDAPLVTYDDVSADGQLCTLMNMNPSAYVTLSDAFVLADGPMVGAPFHVTLCDKEWVATIDEGDVVDATSHVVTLEDVEADRGPAKGMRAPAGAPPITVVVWDLEVLGSDNAERPLDPHFPNAEKDDNAIVVAGMASYVQESSGTMRKVSAASICVRGDGEWPPDAQRRLNDASGGDVRLILVDDEYALLCAMEDYVRESDASVLVDYNGTAFDVPYALARAQHDVVRAQAESVGVGARWPPLSTMCSVLPSVPWVQQEERETRHGGGERYRPLPDTPGVAHMDLLGVVMSTEKYSSYKLDDVALEELGRGKVHFNPWQINAAWRGGADAAVEGRLQTAIYCQRDVDILVQILQKKKYLAMLLALSNQCNTPLDTLLHRGQQERTFRLLSSMVERRGMVVNKEWKYWNEYYAENDALMCDDTVQCKGGFVMEPAKGVCEGPVVIADFNSLYPNIIQEFNFCYSTLFKGWPGGPPPPPGSVHYQNEKGEVLWFVPRSVRHGMVPSAEFCLLEARSETKKAMKRYGKDDVKYANLDKKQQAQKVMANAMYGSFGAHRWKNADVMGAITDVGRRLIEASRDMVDGKYEMRDIAALMSDDVDALRPHLNGTYAKKNSLRVLYGDTDSIMFTTPFDGKTVAGRRLTVKFSKVITAEITRRLAVEVLNYAPEDAGKCHMVIAPDGIMMWCMFHAKKKYAAFMLSEESDADVDAGAGKAYLKGLEVVTRQVCSFLRRTVSRMTALLFPGPMGPKRVSCVEAMFEELDALFSGAVDVEDLSMSKKLAPAYAGPVGGADKDHVAANMRHAARHPGRETVPGGRVVFVVCEGGVDGADKSFKKTEVLEHVLSAGLRPDRLWIFAHSIRSKLETILGHFFPNDGPKIKAVMDAYLADARMTLGGQHRVAGLVGGLQSAKRALLVAARQLDEAGASAPPKRAMGLQQHSVAKAAPPKSVKKRKRNGAGAARASSANRGDQQNTVFKRARV